MSPRAVDTTHERFAALLDRVTLPHGYATELFSDQGRPQLRITCPSGVCNETGGPLPWVGRWWRLSPFMTDSEVVATAFKALLTAIEHETREQFLFDGEAVYDSHLSVHKLAQLRRERHLDRRPDGGTHT